MEFAAEGGEGATPYEVLLRAAIQGDSTQFTRQDSIEETGRILQPLIDHPPEARTYPPGSGAQRRPTPSRPATARGWMREPDRRERPVDRAPAARARAKVSPVPRGATIRRSPPWTPVRDASNVTIQTLRHLAEGTHRKRMAPSRAWAAQP
jgi:hypothetical protein